MRVILLILLSLVALPAQADKLDYAMGKALFDRPWAIAPSSTQASDGLGPLFNARSCVACHEGAGRGHLEPDQHNNLGGTGFVIRIGDKNGKGDPVYGKQLQTNAMQGLKQEGTVFLENNRMQVRDLQYGPLSDGIHATPRLSQPLHGLGLLEKVDLSVLQKLADPDDKNNDGISGRINWIMDSDGNKRAGRFDWKAGAPDLKTQTANAFRNDIGMSTPLRPDHAGDCTTVQTNCLNAPHGNSPQFDNVEISGEMLRLVTAFLQGVKPPPAPDNQDGLDIFYETGCSNCHMPILPLPNGSKVRAYTDLLIHDMGDDLADGIGEGSATGREWRTQPLWGLGSTIRKEQRLLHDGRATTIEEAILWHGGEAAKSKNLYEALPVADRVRLINFLHRL